MVFGRLGVRVLLTLVLIAMIGLVGVVSFTGSDAVLAMDESHEYDIQGGLLMNNQMFSEFSGAPVHLSFHKDTLIDTIKITVETYTDTLEVDSPEEFNLSEGRLLTWFPAVLNGYYTITAKVLSMGEEIDSEPFVIEVGVVDCFAPFTNKKYDIYSYEGINLAGFTTRVDDFNHPDKRIKETAYSGIKDVIVFCDPQNRTIEELDLGTRVRAELILSRTDLQIVYQKTNISGKNHTNEYDIYFDTKIDGTYYTYACDQVDNSSIERMFKLDQAFLYPVYIDNQYMDAYDNLKYASDLINTEGVYSRAVLDDLQEKMMEFIRFSISEADDDVLSLSYANFRETLMLVTSQEDAVFKVSVLNPDVINFDIRLQGFDKNILPSLKLEVNDCQIYVTDYRKDNNLFNEIIKKVSVRGANKIIAIDYKILKDGTLTNVAGKFKFDLAIPKTFKRAAVAVYDGTGYNSVDIQKGKEWLMFDASDSQGVYYLIVYDSAISADLLWLYISLPIVLTILIVVTILYIRKTKKLKNVKTQNVTINDKDRVINGTNYESKVVKAVPKNKKKGNKSKKK